MIEKWRKFLDAGGAFGVLLTDLSKVFNCLPHKLLIAKFHAYGVDIPSLNPFHSYLTKRTQRVKLNGTYSSLSELLFDHCYTWTIVIQHISVRLIPVFPQCRYCELRK